MSQEVMVNKLIRVPKHLDEWLCKLVYELKQQDKSWNQNRVINLALERYLKENADAK